MTDVPWERNPSGTITEVTEKGKVLNYLAQGLNNKRNVFAASLVNAGGNDVGYLGGKAKYKATIKLKITNSGYAGRGIDNAGDIVGWYIDSSGLQNGFLISGGKATTIDYPSDSEVYTVLEGINDKGTITGQWEDTSGIIHGFTYDMKTKKFKDINIPGSVSFVQPWGVNDMGWVAVGSDAGYYVYCPSSKNCVGTAGAYRPPTQKLHPQLP